MKRRLYLTALAILLIFISGCTQPGKSDIQLKMVVNVPVIPGVVSIQSDMPITVSVPAGFSSSETKEVITENGNFSSRIEFVYRGEETLNASFVIVRDPNYIAYLRPYDMATYARENSTQEGALIVETYKVGELRSGMTQEIFMFGKAGSIGTLNEANSPFTFYVTAQNGSTIIGPNEYSIDIKKLAQS